MKLVLSGLERSISIQPGVPAVLQVENQALFSRICESIRSGEGRYASEPYTVWDDDEEIAFGSCFLFVGFPLELPWDERALLGKVAKHFERELLADEELRGSIEKLHARLSAQLLSAGVGLHADYGFELEWDVRRYLKASGFGVNRSSHVTYLENLIEFLSYVLDSGDTRVLVFVNLKTFLTKTELQKFYEHAFFTKAQILMLENKRDSIRYQGEQKHSIDLQFLEE